MNRLLSSLKLGSLELPNRIVMAPMTRSRATMEGLQNPLAAAYYAQRADAGLIVTEATPVSRQGHGYPAIPGMWNDAQEEAWRPIPRAVHDAGGRIFLQIFHTGRSGHSSIFGETVSSSSIPMVNSQVMTNAFSMTTPEDPRALTTEEIPGVVADFAAAARRAISAGFDGVEIHGANSYLIDQFLRSSVNNRADAYGQDRVLFLRQVVEAVAEAIGGPRVGLRLSPRNPWNDMSDENPEVTFVRAAEAARGLAYLHVGEAGEGKVDPLSLEMKGAFGGPLMVAGGYDGPKALQALEDGADLVAFGRPYIASPDLVTRIDLGADLAAPDFETFYAGGEKGYTDYPRLDLAGAR